MKCPICNSDMLGDGFTSPLHCEFTSVDPWVEADADPIFCDAVPIPKPVRFEALRDLLKNEYDDDYGTYPDSVMRLLDLHERYDLLMPNSSEADQNRIGLALNELITEAMCEHNDEQGWTERSLNNSWKVALQTYECDWKVDLI